MDKGEVNRKFRVKTVCSITTGVVDDIFTIERGQSACYKQRKKVQSILDRVKKSSHIYGLTQIGNRLVGKSGKSVVLTNLFSRQYIYHITTRKNNEELIQRILRQRQCWNNNDGKMIIETNMVWGYVSSSQIGRLKSDVVLSRIPGSNQMTNKGNLYENLTKYCQQNSIDMNFVPITFYLNRQNLSTTLRTAINEFLDFFSYIQNHTNLTNVWIMKPTNLNQGKDIVLFNNLQQLLNLLYKGRKIREANTKAIQDLSQQASQQAIYNYVSGNRSLILQKYIQNPLLIDGYKFDIRIWVLIDHNMKFYIFQQGYLRFSGTQYQLDTQSIKDSFMHLTNHSVQKNSKNYQSDKSIQSIQVLKNLLMDKGKTNGWNKINEKIKQIVQITIRACISPVKTSRNKCFEIYGFDFMLDRQLNVRLIEVNCNPAITEDSPLLSELIPKMIDDAFKITIDRMFNCKNTKLHYVQRLNSQNGWEMLGSLIQ